MAEKHTRTPGPWNIINKFCVCAGVDADGDDMVIAVLETGTIARPTVFCRPLQSAQEANARLIAAAPTMLAALEAFISHWDHSDPRDIDYGIGLEASGLVEQLRAAIAQAKGELK